MLILVEQGVKRIRWASGEQAAGPGDAISIQAGEVVDMTNTPASGGEFRALWISWNLDRLAPLLASAAGKPVALHRELETQFRASFERAFEALSDAGDLPTAITASRLHEVLLWLAERGFGFRSAEPGSTREQVREVLLANPAIDWSMEAVALRIACSVATLRRRLAAEGIGFRDLLQDVRMSHALALLQNTDDSVLNVAFAVGYKSASRFTARFRSRFGYVPSDIRGQDRGRTPLRVDGKAAVAAE